jgi:hypothetical protein
MPFPYQPFRRATSRLGLRSCDPQVSFQLCGTPHPRIAKALKYSGNSICVASKMLHASRPARALAAQEKGVHV